MVKRGESINLFLMDGEVTGRIKCTLANWTGLAYKIPRTDLDLCTDRKDLKQSGVYFLFGISEESNGKPVVYIGQAGNRKNGEGILFRLQEHRKSASKDYWNESVVFTTSNNSFGPTEISYLENRFCNMAIAADRYEVKNSNDPSPGNITEEKQSELEDFIDNARLIMGTLGHKVFEPLVTNEAHDEKIGARGTEDTKLYLNREVRNVCIVNAFAQQTAEGMVVLKGSYISPKEDEAIPAAIKIMREKALLDDEGCTKENYLFSSPTYAAIFVLGKSANGLTEWKNQEGRTLKSIGV